MADSLGYSPMRLSHNVLTITISRQSSGHPLLELRSLLNNQARILLAVP